MERDVGATAALLHEIGQRVALTGGNPYRARAYTRAAESLMTLLEPLDEVIASGRLRELPGIGAAIAGIIPTLHETGTHPMLEELRADIPDSVLPMLAIPGLKPDKVLALFGQLGIRSIAELEQAAGSGALDGAKGFGPAFARKVLQGIRAMNEAEGRRHMHRAAALLDEVAARLGEAVPGLKSVEIAGELRRGCELVGDLALVATTPGVAEVVRSGEVTVYLTPTARRGATLLHATGSAAHLAELGAVAARKGYRLEQEGLVTDAGVVAKSEKDIYGALGMEWVPPELREGAGEIGLALEHRLPRLVTEKDLRGILHAHTTESDGADTLEDMAEAVRARGYAYLGISDHSQSAHYAGGLKLAQIEAQHAAIDRLNAGYGGSFRILKGIESDIRADGSLDYEDDVLARFDFVVASVHGKFGLDEAAQTARLVRAAANPFTTMIGHMTGRQLLRRPGYEVDVDAVLQACARHGVVVEINANPWRLDLDWRWHRRALALGCMLSINPDAHSTAEIDMVRWGVAMARKGGVPKSRVLNCLDWPRLSKFLEARRAGMVLEQA